MLNFCGIVVAILKMETGRNFSMSGINSGRWNRTMLNLCGSVAAILKMATGRNFPMSGINSGHHNLPTYKMSLKSDNVEFVRYCGWSFWKWNGHHNTAKIQHCPILSKFDMWVDNDVPNWFLTLKYFYRSPFSKWPPTIPHKFNIVRFQRHFICG
jgi:hypothetical protein